MAELAVAASLLVVAVNSVFVAATVTSEAMQPGFRAGERIAALRLPLALAVPRRGELVLVREPLARSAANLAQSEFVLRRVIGLPGEKISVRGRQVLVNDAVLDEPYLLPNIGTDPLNFAREYRLQDDEFLVLSDSRESLEGFADGRNWGAIPASRMVGRAVAVFWPLDGVRVVQSARYEN